MHECPECFSRVASLLPSGSSAHLCASALQHRVAVGGDVVARRRAHPLLGGHRLDPQSRIGLLPVDAVIGRQQRADGVLVVADDRCRDLAPPLREVGAQHLSECWKAPLDAQVLVPARAEALVA